MFTVGEFIYLHASDNNRANIVLKLFTDAVDEVGLSICVQANRGGENVKVARYMISHPLSTWGRFITG